MCNLKRVIFTRGILSTPACDGHVETQTMQTADCRLQTVQTVQTVQTECYFFTCSSIF